MVGANDPMWRGGLSAPRSLYLHSGRPLIESDGPTSRAIWWGFAAGVTTSIGVVGLYVALARGNMTVVAPVTGLVAAIVPAGVTESRHASSR